MTDTFFDLQRFAVLVGGQSSSFTWKDGELFGGTSTADLGTSSNPAYLAVTGGLSTAAGTDTDIYLNGEKSYNFSLDGKDGWNIKLGTDNVAHVTNGASGIALANLTGENAAVLTINGEFAEDIGADVTTTSEAKASLTSDGVLTFGKAVEGATINLNTGDSVVLNKGGQDLVVNNGVFNGIDIEKKATLTSLAQDGAVAQIVTGNNSITMSTGNVTEIKADKDTNVTIGSDQVISGAKGVTLKTASNGFNVPTTVNGTTWSEITGDLASIAFDSLGSAKIENTGAVVVDGQDGAIATVQSLTSATVNDVKVTADEESTVTFELETLEGGGISAIDVSKALGKDITVAGDQVFDVKAGKTADYVVVTDDDSIVFNANASQIQIEVEKEQHYVVAGGTAKFNFTDSTTVATLNGAQVSVKTASEDIYAIASDENAGIDVLAGVNTDNEVSVANDSDGFVTTFDSVEGSGEVVFKVNNASIRAANVEGQVVSISINGGGTEALVTGLNTTEQVSVAGTGMTYHFKDITPANQVVAADEATYVTLDGAGAIADAMDDTNYKKLKENDAAKWNNVASIGNDSYIPGITGDTVAANRSYVYEQFYNLGTSDAGQATLAVFANEDATVASSVANPNGVTFTGSKPSKPLAENAHVTLTAGSNVGAAPINIQRNESSAVVDAVIDLRSATLPSTVAVGTLDSVTASHTIYLSNTGTGYVNVGELATGQNRIFAGTSGAQIRHDGERATVYGNRGDDTIWAGQHDIVRGSLGADQFYDSANYTILDYNAAEGDALIATRLHSVSDVNKDNIVSAANKVSFGTGRNSFTIGQDQNASLTLNVAVMNTDANIVGSRNVVLAGANGGAVDASALTAGALILADADRNGFSGDNVTGTAYADEIYVGSNDYVNGGAGNDYITIGGISATSGNAGVEVAVGSGNNTVAGWVFGFDTNAGATELIAGENYVGTFENDRLKVTDANGSILFEDTKQTAQHGQYDVLVNGKKYTAIRTNDSNNTNPESYGYVESNADIADVYLAEREGILTFGAGVTENLHEVRLGSTEFQNITNLTLLNNSKTDVYGTSDRETVALGGDASVGANKRVSLGAGNDVIFSTGDNSVTAGHEFYFGTEDGRDTIRAFSHYLGGVESDPDKQYADTLVLEKFGGLYTGTDESGKSRIEFVTEGDNRVFLYEEDGINVDKMYQIKVGAFDTKIAKIGNSNTANVFNFDSAVDYYVGSSAENAQDTLVVSNADVNANVNVWLDGSNGTDHTSADEHYFRGIKFIDAGAQTDTNVSLAGAGGNDTLIAGGAGTYNYLWGGSGDNVLIGSETSNQDYFFYVRNAGAYLQTVDDDVTGGHDEVYNYDFENNDVIWLGDTTLDDISGTSIEDNAVTIEFKNGGSLTVNSTDNVRVRINEGAQCYIADKETGTWSHE